ncbi:Tannase/feruloyl esterase [Plectosphaerella cucumerina]|uniref:Carboxylic ester hydrolase n=1 Tax=Plectosphaerella cucumerina TaxID=40658 RepID=A0A8K0TF96_9PEZI|nr:Tannase/feruloyl esterase [Plectosphaerella cucumerina]
MSFPSIGISACADALIQLSTLPGAEILSLTASPVLNHTQTVSSLVNPNHPTVQAKGVDFCNVTITYTHPGQGDEVGVETWLPLSTWNGRIQSVGGGGWVAGRFFLSYDGMTGAIAEGYVTSSTDAGLRDKQGSTASTPKDWAMVSEGNANLYALQNLGTVSLHDQAILIKALTKSFYGQEHMYAYWSGCSQGGRQGLSLAQNYPNDYDGIAAASPGIFLTQIFGSTLWGHVLMQNGGEFPHGCEFDRIHEAVIAECDRLDGLVDGLVSDEAACQFDPLTLVGQSFYCSDTGRTTVVSQVAAKLSAAVWAGPRSSRDEFLWFGPNMDARLAGNAPVGSPDSQHGLAQTACRDGTCEAMPVGLGDMWFPLFVQRNSSTDWKDYTPETYAKLFEKGVREFDGLIGTSNPDLSDFSNTGGKMITYHGTADEIIPFKQMKHYYDQVLRRDPDARDFYRLFEVPGLAHCAGGNGGQPTAVWDALVAWVEKGEAPDTLPIYIKNDFVEEERLLRPYPQKPYSSNCGGRNATIA